MAVPSVLSSTKPDPDQLEVSLFGPGYGECVVCHCAGSWFIIDSCTEGRDRTPVAQEYLERLGVSPADVKCIICTHWHDDHVRGFANLVRAFPGAKVAFSAALQKAEFDAIMRRYAGWHDDFNPVPSGVRELREAFGALAERGDIPNFALEARTLWKDDTNAVVLTALSPCDKTLLNAYADWAQLKRDCDGTARAIPSPKTNHVAVALHLQVGGRAVILGSDLEEHRVGGWTTIVNCSTRPHLSGSLYKVAHHGSETGHCSAIWQSVLSAAPVSIITPFVRGRVSLPTDDDKARIVALSSTVAVTNSSKPGSIARRGALGKMVASKGLLMAQSTMGSVRCRLNPDVTAQWNVELAGSAYFA